MNRISQLPNIVTIILDTVRADRLSCYGHNRRTTPFIDSLANDGLLFERAIATSSWSLPSHISLFSGLYPSEHQVWDRWEDNRISLPVTTADQLSSIGYQTVCFSSNAWLQDSGLDRAFDLYSPYYYHEPKAAKKDIGWLLKKIKMMSFVGDKGARRMNLGIARWLEDERDKHHPFYLVINFMEAHQPYSPPRPFHKAYSSTPYRTLYAYRQSSRYERNYLQPDSPISQQTLRDAMNLYDGEISYLDVQVEQLVENLEKNSVLDNTIIFILSDHGDNFGEHQLNGIPLVRHRFSIHDTLIRVPLIVYGPNFIARGRVKSVVSLADVAPTVTEIAGPDPLIANNFSLFSPEADRIVISEYRTPKTILNQLRRYAEVLHVSTDVSNFDLKLAAVCNTRYKLVKTHSRGGDQFYDVSKDPFEQNPIPVDENASPEVKRAYLQLDGFHADWSNNLRTARMQDYDLTDDEQQELTARLQDLGYL